MLIKSGNKTHGFDIQRLGTAEAKPAADTSTSQTKIENPFALENERLLLLLEERDAKITEHSDAVKNAFSEGEEAGRAAAEAEFDNDRAAALALLSDGIEAAKVVLNNALENSESIALMVAQIALDKMFGELTLRKAATVDLIKQQFEQIGHDSFVVLEVSRGDFPNTDEVAELCASLSIMPESVRVSENLEPGDCRMQMELGSLSIGINQQWGAIRELLENMAGRDEAEVIA